MKTTLLGLILATFVTVLAAAPTPPGRKVEKKSSVFEHALLTARDALAAEQLDKAREMIQKALERDPKSPRAWALRAEWAEAIRDQDEQVFALHKQFNLMVAQKAPRKELVELQARIEELDPVAKDLFRLREGFIDRLEPIAGQYEKDRRPHSAIRVLQEILALDPERAGVQEAIERISSAPDPSLAATAKPKDLMEDVSEEWVREHDAKHRDWKKAAETTRDNYVTKTNAGYEVLVRAAEAMEQMNAFYRQFFRFGHGRVRRVRSPASASTSSRTGTSTSPSASVRRSSGRAGTSPATHVETYMGDGGFPEE